MAYDSPAWLIGRPNLQERSRRNGWWWGRYSPDGLVTYSGSYDPDAWLDGVRAGALEALEAEGEPCPADVREVDESVARLAAMIGVRYDLEDDSSLDERVAALETWARSLARPEVGAG